MSKKRPESKTTVYGALAANVIIAIAKIAVALTTRSSAMLSEGIHSSVDSANEVLLLLGLKSSKKPADERHPFGHGSEVYFWSLIVAVMIFGLGGGVTIYEGILHIIDPIEIIDPLANYLVLGIAVLFESISLFIASKNFKKDIGKKPFWSSLKGSKDATSISVISEDIGALIGIFIAIIGITLSVVLHSPVYDGGASIFIGMVLIGVALFLASEIRGLLVGESVDNEILDGIKEIAKKEKYVVSIDKPLTMHLSPNEVLLTMHVTFKNYLGLPELARAIDNLENQIKEIYPLITYIYIEAESVAQIK